MQDPVSPTAAPAPALDFAASPVDVARQLVGWTLLVDSVGGVIVETEAYDEDDPASHGFGGPRPRNASMFGPPGRAYVYLSHGLHWCLNFVCREAGRGAAVLVRALEPTEGLERMRERRGVSEPRLLAAGPGRLGQALAIDRSFDGLALDRPPFEFRPPTGTVDVVADVRIGITKAAERPWRFVALGSRFLSRPVKRSTGAPAGR